LTDAQQVVKVPAGDREKRVPGLLCLPADILRRVVGVQPHHVGSWRHQLAYGTIVEP
jgi:hypothetical protein